MATMKIHIVTVCNVKTEFNFVTIRHINSQKPPKDICKDRIIGTFEAPNSERLFS